MRTVTMNFDSEMGQFDHEKWQQQRRFGGEVKDEIWL